MKFRIFNLDELYTLKEMVGNKLIRLKMNDDGSYLLEFNDLRQTNQVSRRIRKELDGMKKNFKRLNEELLSGMKKDQELEKRVDELDVIKKSLNTLEEGITPKIGWINATGDSESITEDRVREIIKEELINPNFYHNT